MIKLLKELIGVKSANKDGANELIEFCGKWLTERGLTCRIVENCGYKSLISEIGDGKKTLVLNGHVDVVNGTSEQFVPVEECGRIYGRGAADMKAGVAALMKIMVDLSNRPPACRVQLQLVSDEETGGNNCTRQLVESDHRGDFVICAEPTQLGLAIQAKGILQIDMEIIGRSAHGSRPWEGDNAILQAYKVYNEITKLPFAIEKSTLYNSPSINLAKLQGGDVYNKVPDACLMSLDIRYLPEQDAKEILRQVGSVTPNVKVHAIGEPVKTSANNQYVLCLGKIVQRHTGEVVRIFGQHGSADTRFFSKYQIPAIEFGPIGGNWHGNEEYVEIESINKYVQILREFIDHFGEDRL